MTQNKMIHNGSIVIDNERIKEIRVSTARIMRINDRKGSVTIGKDAEINLVDSRFSLLKTFCRRVLVA